MFLKLKKYFCKAQKDEKGIAILFTLGILSLLLVMALSFATDSIVERKTAFNNNSRTQARLIAKSALNRAVAAIKYYTSDSIPTPFTNAVDLCNIVSHVSAAAPSKDVDFINRLTTNINGSPVFTYQSKTTTAPDAIHWQYISDGDATNPRYIGRFAYSVIPDSGRIDPSAAVDSGAPGNIPESTANKLRPGVNVNECYLMALNNSTATGSDLATANLLNLSSIAAGGKLVDETRWLSFEQMFSKNFLDIDSSSADNLAKKFKMMQWFTLDGPPDIEAYWAPAAATSEKRLLTEMRHRFNLARPQTEWNNGLGTTVNSDTAVKRLLCEAETDSPVIFKSTDTPTLPITRNAGIQYLRKICDTAGTFTTVRPIETRRCQIAANLLDYCDNDSIPTSDVPAASWSNLPGNIPTYTGNEKTLYINELTVELGVSINVDLDGSGVTYVVGTQPYIIPTAELINIYDATTAAGYMITLYGSLSYTIDIAGQAPINVSTEQFVTTPVNAWTAGNPGYYKETGTKKDLTLQTSLPGVTLGSSYSITNVKITIDKAILTGPGGINDKVDYASPTKNADFTGSTVYGPWSVAAGPKSDPMWYFGSQTNDPRQNLNATDWNSMFDSKTLAAFTATLGQKNSSFGAGAIPIPDTETTTDPAYVGAAATQHISTAYIRNAAMQSPWELGCIHRGAAWETINLKNANTTVSYAAPAYAAGTAPVGDLNNAGGSYLLGDAGILDQVKMTPYVRTYGKLELNMRWKDVLRTLTLGIYPDSGYNTPGAQTGTAVSYADAETFAGQIIARTSLFKHRSWVANQIIPLATSSTDATKEAIIGKFINLTKAYEPPNEIRLIILAQSIQDVGTTAGITISKDLNGDGNTTGSATQDLDGDGTPETLVEESVTAKLNEYKPFIDEITGEQKMLVTISRDPATNKLTIKKIEYLQD